MLMPEIGECPKCRAEIVRMEEICKKIALRGRGEGEKTGQKMRKCRSPYT